MSERDAFLFTSESVTEGHPDKVADQISDAVLDEVMRQDPQGRVACETLVTTGLVLIAGEITTSASLDFIDIARRTVRDIGYTKADHGFHYDNLAVLSAIEPQSTDIAMGVDVGGAGDQGMMFGFATNETPQLMPLLITLAHALTRRLAEARHAGEADGLRPDGKSQVTVEYDAAGKPTRVHTVVVSTQHDPDLENDELRQMVIDKIIRPAVPGSLMDEGTIIHVNPTGRFVTGGPKGDCGLTGRKIIVDTYGGSGRHGGGAFSGKDPTKVDRSATYMARHIAKCLVAAELADQVEVQLAYAIGVAEPVSVRVQTFGTGRIPEARLEALVRDRFPLTPAGIIEHLDLRRPIYRQTAAYGHFGRDEPELKWEDVSLVGDLRAVVGGEVAATSGVGDS